MSLHFQNQVIRNPEGKIKYRYLHQGGREHFHLGVWLEGAGEELDAVERVEYLLDPSFKQPLRKSSNRENKFSVTFWTYGMFPMQGTIYYRDGHKETVQYYLSFNLPEDDGTNYALA